ncbi:hypothetical protein J4218_00330 [Candidatus Pacearchaeota archaeon]|nr:hypothetical protein [Candidatus Pacearchaeota archaeon]
MVKKKSNKKTLFTRRLGIYMMIIGVAMQFLNIITHGYWEIDIDILGVLIFIVGLIITIVKWNK